MLIIIEGPDCSGKSTLARRIVGEIRRIFDDDASTTHTVWHRKRPTQHPLVEYAAPLLTYHADDNRHIICDRWHVGERVYPQTRNRSTQLDDATNAWLELFLRSRGALLVYLRRDADYLANCAASRGAIDDAAHVHRDLAAFDRACFDSLLPLTVFERDPTDVEIHSIIDDALHHGVMSTSYMTPRHSTYVGSDRPTLLLFGDRRGVAGDPAEYGDWPAFAPFAATSGHYLFSALTREQLRVPTHGVVMSTLGVANANDVDDPMRLWRALGTPPVVALGVEVRKKLRQVGVPITRTVPHPQYWRRFRHHESDTYLHRLLGLDPIEEKETVDA